MDERALELELLDVLGAHFHRAVGALQPGMGGKGRRVGGIEREKGPVNK